MILHCLGDGASMPTGAEFAGFVQTAAWLFVLIGSVIGCFVGIKQLRHKPMPHVPINQPFEIKLAEEYATKDELKTKADLAELRAVDKQFRERSEAKERRMTEIEASVGRLVDGLGKTREDVRHDLRNELGPINQKIDDRAKDAEDQFRKLAGDIGGLTSASNTAASTQAENRRILDTILQRLPRGGGRE